MKPPIPTYIGYQPKRNYTWLIVSVIAVVVAIIYLNQPKTNDKEN